MYFNPKHTTLTAIISYHRKYFEKIPVHSPHTLRTTRKSRTIGKPSKNDENLSKRKQFQLENSGTTRFIIISYWSPMVENSKLPGERLENSFGVGINGISPCVSGWKARAVYQARKGCKPDWQCDWISRRLLRVQECIAVTFLCLWFHSAFL